MRTLWEAVILSGDLEWRYSLAHILAENGIDSVYASSIEECKEIVSRECVGLVFWDSHLAVAGYQELVRSVQSLDYRVKIVVISHLDDWEQHLATAREGAFGVIPFPCHPTDIEWVLSRAARAEREETTFGHPHELQVHVHR
jgi:DNA-binding NtrC family response regulator